MWWNQLISKPSNRVLAKVCIDLLGIYRSWIAWQGCLLMSCISVLRGFIGPRCYGQSFLVISKQTDQIFLVRFLWRIGDITRWLLNNTHWFLDFNSHVLYVIYEDCAQPNLYSSWSGCQSLSNASDKVFTFILVHLLFYDRWLSTLFQVPHSSPMAWSWWEVGQTQFENK